jgi:predicted alpha/beta-fold hydrolase
LRSFVPIVRNPHLITIAGNYWKRPLDEARFPVLSKLYETEPSVTVLVHEQRPEDQARGEVILVHGLEGSSDAGYARSAAQAGLEAGYAVHRFNMRSCGGTEASSGSTLYHSGQTGDLLCVARKLAADGCGPIFLIGFSLGGNVVLKLAGELRDSGPELLGGVCAVSTPIDLAACVRELRKRANFIYSNRFLSRLKDRIRRKERLTPGLFRLDDLSRVRSIYDFDDLFTARTFGFGSADRYYSTQASNQYLEHIRVPALIVQAKDDPLIPFEIFDQPAFLNNACLRLLAVEHGGHLGFIARNRPRFWLDEVVLEWLQETRNKISVALVP